MTEIFVALIGAVSIIAATIIEHGRRQDKKNWEQNRSDHDFVVEKIETIGKSLGKSIDRVEKTAERTEKKLDQHINDHVTGRLD